MRAHLALALVAGAALGGCLVLTDLSGLAGDPAPDPVEPTDAATEAAQDGAPGDDAGTDGRTDGDADATSPFCATHPGHTACLDFDDGVLPADWVVDVTGGALSWSSTRAVSPPGALFSTQPRRPTIKSKAMLRKRMDTSFRHTVVEFDLYVEPPAWQAGDVNAGVFEISFFSSTVSGGIAVSIGQSYVTIGAPEGSVQSNMPLPFGEWVHAKVDLDPAGRLEALIGTVPLAKTFAALTAGTSAQTVVYLGVNGYNAPAPQFEVYYDNVTIDLP
jgi:hypothetical protein